VSGATKEQASVSATACIICKKPVKPRAENKAFPFCSERCRQVDLGKWLNEEYRVPAEEADDDVGAGGADADSVEPKGRN
jgi:endogenous inhibitor of DNA gyrase (YacG/DUF329 family)